MSRGGRGFNNRGRQSYNRGFDKPTGELMSFGKYLHAAENTMVFKATSTEQYPAFNAPVFNANKQEIGKIGEVFGPLNDYYFSVAPTEGVKANSFQPDENIFLYSEKLFSVDRLKNPPPPRRGGGNRGGNQRGGQRSFGGNQRGGQGGQRNSFGGQRSSFGGQRSSFGGNPRGGQGGSFGGQRNSFGGNPRGGRRGSFGGQRGGRP
ncbi:H/ACA ribonucleoprotein complex subunit [Entamoeba marina]